MKKVETTQADADLHKKELCAYIDNTEFSDEIKKAVKGMLGVVLPSGDNDMSLDLADFEVIVNHGGVAFSGIGEFDGKNSAAEAIRRSIENSSLEYNLINKMSGILIHFTIHPDFSIEDIAEAMEIIHENAHDESDIMWGTTTDKSVSKSYVKASILFTGFEKNGNKYIVANNIDYGK
ncbi:hypothetical protein [Sulfurimonas hydrogeniphila]|uniref:hypothetical protein n=1 Tax=Sulfurimonas hydrogeniphila TaxID=2509341 RepID=UPI00125F20D0|nr:hypothetical protein [Sulfurimonas hydrogeniphila]